MINNKRTRLIMDIGMVILLPLLMAYSLIGEAFHYLAVMILFAVIGLLIITGLTNTKKK